MCKSKKHQKLVHLHCHTYHSILDGAGSIDDYIKKAKEFGHPAIAITDHGTMSGTFEHFQKCKAAGIKPIIGMEAYLNDRMNKFANKQDEGKDNHQLILIKDQTGFVNLNRLVYRSMNEGFYYRPRITTDWLLENKSGLIVTSSCLASKASQLLLNGKEFEAEEYFKLFHREFGEDFYAEIQLNEAKSKEGVHIQKLYNDFVIRMSQKYDIMPILTGDVHYANPEDNKLQDTLIAINQHKKLGDAFSLQTRYLYYGSGDDFHQFNEKFGFKYDEKFLDMCLENTTMVADKCNFEFEVGVEKYPVYEPTEDVKTYFKTENSVEIIKKLSSAKLMQKLKRYQDIGMFKVDEEFVKKYKDRLEYEISVIESKKMLDYFLVNWEIIRDYRSKGFEIGPARGCFVPNSRVKMTGGMYSPIDTIETGDIVIDAFGDEREVIDTLNYDIEESVIELEFEDGRIIECTLDHEILTENRGWVQAKDLTHKDNTSSIDGVFTKLKNRKIKNYKGRVFDLTIESTHSYNIEGIGVHNSAAGSLLSWCLDITKIDPVRFELYFERFLNPERSSPPDLDVDYSTGTDYVVDEFLNNKYGKDRVLPVATFSTFNAKGCLKDVVRAHRGQGVTGFDSDVFQVTKEIPDFTKVEYDFKWWVENWPNDERCSDVTRKFLTDPVNEEIIQQTLKLQGQIRGIGQHAAGVVITPTSSWEHIPVNIISKNKTIVTAFQEADKSGKDLSALGILKLDRLKLETINIIMDSIDMIKQNHNIDIKNELDFIDIDNKDLYEELRSGMNHGIFQFESTGMNALIRGIQVENFNELVAANALYRPGPMGIGAHEEYIKNKFDKNNIKYVHPSVESILRETNGVMIYQEQLMFIADKVGGMGLGAGDSLRRYMDKASKIIAKEASGQDLTEREINNKDYQGFKKYWDKFLDGAEKNGYKKDEVDALKGWIINYLGYSFNKCLTKNHIVISKERGDVNILDVKIGERILGYDTVNKKDVFNPVKNIHINGKKKVYRVKTESGKIIECTEDHKIMAEVGMKTLKDIIDCGLSINVFEGLLEKIISLEEVGEVETYDLEIDSVDHNFYANGVCVSNSHSLSYSYLALQTIYLKRYYPVEFYCALLNHPKSSGDKDEQKKWLSAAIYSAVSKGIKILPPSLKSGKLWSITGHNEISMGLSSIDGFGDAAYDELLEISNKKGKPICDFTKEEFFSQNFSKFNKTSFESCLKAGVFDKFSNSRNYLSALKENKRGPKSKVSENQLSMWDISSFETMPNVDESLYEPTSDIVKKVDFIEVCNFDIEEILAASELRRSIEAKYGFVENILNFTSSGRYYFVAKEIKVHQTKKGNGIYLRLKVGDGLSHEYINMFEPLASKYANFFKRNGVYLASFNKNDKGFLNFQNKSEIKGV